MLFGYGGNKEIQLSKKKSSINVLFIMKQGKSAYLRTYNLLQTVWLRRAEKIKRKAVLNAKRVQRIHTTLHILVQTRPVFKIVFLTYYMNFSKII